VAVLTVGRPVVLEMPEAGEIEPVFGSGEARELAVVLLVPSEERGADVDDPGVDDPGVEGPGVDDPDVEGPGVDDSCVDDTGVEGPGVEGPGVDDPCVDDPGVEGPGVALAVVLASEAVVGMGDVGCDSEAPCSIAVLAPASDEALAVVVVELAPDELCGACVDVAPAASTPAELRIGFPKSMICVEPIGGLTAEMGIFGDTTKGDPMISRDPSLLGL
jgi:hypothetical protein